GNHPRLPSDEAHRDAPAPILTNVGAVGDRSASWYVDGASAALMRASEDMGTRVPGQGRSRCLVAMPTVGIAGGGGHDVRGDVIAALLEEATTAAAKIGVDVVLVTNSEPSYAAAQSFRRKSGRRPTAHRKLVDKLAAYG